MSSTPDILGCSPLSTPQALFRHRTSVEAKTPITSRENSISDTYVLHPTPYVYIFISITACISASLPVNTSLQVLSPTQDVESKVDKLRLTNAKLQPDAGKAAQKLMDVLFTTEEMETHRELRRTKTLLVSQQYLYWTLLG